MSKKFEALKNAVFYSEQKPELLAGYLSGLVTDTITTVSVSGADTITVGSTDVTSTFTADAFSQFGDPMTGIASFALPATRAGITINSTTGVLTVTSVATAGPVTVEATIAGKKGTKRVMIAV